MEKKNPVKNSINENQNKDKDKDNKDKSIDIPICNYAPEWSEHARFDRSDEPCDDGRMGVQPCAEYKEGEACPVTDNRMSEDLKKL